ncbi:hypothetical protein ULG90_20800 [Halopseudomonas pachastrellae]|nr:hypothetical protein ULG90_20800 [Halopseudomonas pachastrellae]
MTDTQSISATRPMIELSDVTVRYGGNVVALDNTTLRIDKGDFVALVGPSCWNRPPRAAIVGGREVGARQPRQAPGSGLPEPDHAAVAEHSG